MTAKTKSPQARRALATLGQNLKTARIKRRISIKGFADRVGVSESTVIRLEKGEDGVSIGTLAMACLVLGEIGRISRFLDPGTDDTGRLLDRQSLPKRIDSKRRSKLQPGGDAAAGHSSADDDEEGADSDGRSECSTWRRQAASNRELRKFLPCVRAGHAVYRRLTEKDILEVPPNRIAHGRGPALRRVIVQSRAEMPRADFTGFSLAPSTRSTVPEIEVDRGPPGTVDNRQ